MSLPGLQVNSVPVVEKTSIVHDLSAGTEWRFEVAFGENVEVKVTLFKAYLLSQQVLTILNQLLTGHAEIFGTELAVNQSYAFNGRKAAIYTWHGCRIEVTGNCQSDYTAEETPMVSYANLHFALENLRDAALEGNTMGPRVLVVGPENAGKTSLVKMLAAYATRSERQPIVVNLDPKEGLLSVPGTLSTVVLDSVIDVEEGWGISPTNGPSQIPVKLPLVYYYGMEDPEAHGELYKPLVTRLALSVMNRLEEDRDAKPSGCFVDTSGSVSMGKAGYDLIHHMVAEFSSKEAPLVSPVVMGTLNADKHQSTSWSSSGLSAFIATCHGALPNKVLVIAVPSQSSNLTSLAAVSTATANMCSSSDKRKSESTSSAMSETL